MDGVKYRCWDNFNAEFTYSEIMGLAEFFKDYEMRIEGDNKSILEQYINKKDLMVLRFIRVIKSKQAFIQMKHHKY